MIEYQKALEVALEWLNKIEEARVLGTQEKKTLSLPQPLEVWEVVTEITNSQAFIDTIKLYLIFTPEFPLSFPIVLLAEADYNRYKHIPHVQTDRLICTFGNKTFPNPSYPDKVVEEVVKRAKRIIEEGIQGVNFKDFEDEFVAYWNGEYSPKDKVLDNLVLLAEKPLNQDVRLIVLNKPYNSISYVVHSGEDIAERFILRLEEKKIRFKEVEVLFAGKIPLQETPPFSLTNQEALNLLEKSLSLQNQDYIKFINSRVYPKLVLFQKELYGEVKYFGWFHNAVKLNRNGFRKGALTNLKVMKTFAGGKLVTRVNPQTYSPHRLVIRSAGIEESQKPSTFCISGLGSIGSNLLHFLNQGPKVEFRLVDPEKLELENLGRHLLGLNYLNWYKTKGIRDYLLAQSPIQKVTTKELSILTLLEKEPDFINGADFLFVVIGEANIESWIAKQLKLGKIKVPVIFLWVEPYLLGGHCLYLNPNNANYESYFEDGIFKFNVIDNSETSNPILLAKEAGCQTNYTPYSNGSIQLFLGGIGVKLLKIITEAPQCSRALSWMGDSRVAEELGIKLSKAMEALTFGDVIEKEL